MSIDASPSATPQVTFAIPEDAIVQLEVFDVNGRRLSQLQNGRVKAGTSRKTWLGRDMSGSAVPTGIYYVQMRVNGSVVSSSSVVVVR